MSDLEKQLPGSIAPACMQTGIFDALVSAKNFFVVEKGGIVTGRSGPANLNSAISGNAGHQAGPMQVWQEEVLHGQEICAAHPPHPYAGVQGASRPCCAARGQDLGRSGQAVCPAPQPDHRVANAFGGDAADAAEPVDLQPLHAKIGQLTLENDFLERARTKAGLLSAKR